MKPSNQNLFLAVALWLACMVGIYTFFPGVIGAKRQPAAQQPAATPSQPPPAPRAAPAAAPPETPKAAAGVPRGTTTRAPRRQVTLQTARLRLTLTSDGAAVEHALLLGEKYTRHKGSKEESQVDLVQERSGEPLPLSTAVKGADGSVVVPADAAYELLRHDETSAVFRTEQGGVEATKTFRLDVKTYGIQLAVELRAASGFNGSLSVLTGAHAEEPQGGLFGSRSNTPARAICAAGNKTERLAVGAKTPVFEAQGASFAGLDEQYFLTAVAAPAGVAASCRLEAQGQKSGSLVAALNVPIQAGAASATQIVLTAYAGPKDNAELEAVARPLRQSIDWGFWSVIAELLLGIMKFFYRVVPPHNWGIAIILLTLAMKALTFPLQHKSMKSMQEMQRIQPQLEELKKKYAGDTQRQNLEQMKLFKEHGVNPMGSCLPMLIQMPIWFALYTTLQVSVELYNAPFIHGWLDDLTSKDPYYILPVAMGATMILTQVLTPSPMSNPSQKTMGYVMSGFFSLLMLTLPSGLTLYIFTNNVLSIAQQIYLRRTIGRPPAAGVTLEVKKKDERRAGDAAAPRAKLGA